MMKTPPENVALCIGQLVDSDLDWVSTGAYLLRDAIRGSCHASTKTQLGLWDVLPPDSCPLLASASRDAPE
jgi:hypothetical protein